MENHEIAPAGANQLSPRVGWCKMSFVQAIAERTHMSKRRSKLAKKDGNKGFSMANPSPMQTPSPAIQPPPASIANTTLIETRIGVLEKEFSAIQGRIDRVVALLKWTGGFVMATLLAVVIQMISVSFSAGRLQEKVDTQAGLIQDMKMELREVKSELRLIREELSKLRRGDKNW